MNPLHLHVYPSDFRHDSRIQKVTRSLVAAGLADRIVLAGLASGDTPASLSLDSSRTVWLAPTRFRSPIPFTRSAARYLEWYARVLAQFWQEDVEVVHCNSLQDLPIGVVLKWAKGARLVYDAHELETERNGLRGIARLGWKVVERALIRQADAVFVVSPSIARWYREHYGCEVEIVRNVPVASPPAASAAPGPRLRETLGIRDGLVFLYLGALQPGRGLDLLIEAFTRLPADRHLVLAGYGPLLARATAAAAAHRNIHTHPAVTPEEVVSFSRGADVGLALIENTCLSYYFCLPNKLFEYILAGVPPIVSDFPDMGAVVDEAGVGWKVAVSVEALVELIGRIEPGEVASHRQRCESLATQIGWHTEETTLLRRYRATLNRG